MKILITGSSGFVGKHLVKKLSAKHNIVKYDLKDGQDILNKSLLIKKLKEVNLVIHLAAFISASQSWEKPEDYFRNNSIGTLSVVKSSIKAGVKKIIFFSSAAVKAKPLTPYAVSKIAAENILKLFKKDLDIVVLRPENIYGAGQRDAYGYVIHNFIKATKHKKDINIFGTGRQTRDFIYIDDVVKAVERLAQINVQSGSVVSLGTGKQTKIVDLARLVMKLMNKKTGIKYTAKRKEPSESVANTAQIRKLGIDPEGFVDLDHGIKKLL